GSTVVGGEAIRGAAGLGAMAKAAGPVEKAYLASNPGKAAAFARDYPKRGMSHHILHRAAKRPQVLGGVRYPEELIEIEFNKIQHGGGISYRDVYRNHVGVGGRKHFSGGRLPPEFGGGGWKAKDLDWDMD